MPLRLEPATDHDAAAIAALRMAVAQKLTDQYGRGTWSYATDSTDGVRLEILSSNVFVARDSAGIAATLRLSTRQPWMGAMDFFTPSAKPVFLTSMAVAPRVQRQGVGRECLEDVRRLAREWEADAIRLDAYDAPAGAGEFYRKNGYSEVRRAPYNGTPLIFFELLLAGPRGPERRPAAPAPG